MVRSGFEKEWTTAQYTVSYLRRESSRCHQFCESGIWQNTVLLHGVVRRLDQRLLLIGQAPAYKHETQDSMKYILLLGNHIPFEN